ncbi:MAG: hypothetical protein WAL84_08350 [Candidatus Dormiibacterota bacterium]
MRMSYITRATLAIGACAVMGATAGCGGDATVANTTSDPAAGLPSVSASPSVCANPQVTSATSPVIRLALTVSDLPAGGPPLEQISDGEMNKTANTDQRGFANTGNTYRVEDDVVLDTSTQAAGADYPQLRDAVKAQFATLTSTSSPATLGCQADEFAGKASTGYSQVGIAFQDGDVIVVVLVVNSAGPVDAAFAAAVALAQDQKIVATAS